MVGVVPFLRLLQLLQWSVRRDNLFIQHTQFIC